MKELRQVRSIWLVVGIVLLGAVSAWGTTYNVVPGQSIQAAIDAASPGDTINVAAGIYNENLNIIKSVTISGAGIDQVTLLPVTTGYGIGISGAGNNVTIEGMTIAAGNAMHFLLHVSHISDFLIRNVKVVGAGQATLSGGQPLGGVDLISVKGATISDVEVQHLSRNGVSLTDSTSVALENLNIHDIGVSSGWAGVAFYTSLGGIVSGTFLGTSVITNTPMGIYVEDYPFAIANLNAPGGSIAFANQSEAPLIKLGQGSTPNLDTTALGLGLVAKLSTPEFPIPPYDTGVAFYSTVDEAMAVAVVDPAGAEYAVVFDLNLTQFFVGPGMRIQRAVNAAVVNDDIHVLDGTYPEKVLGSSGDDLTFAGAGASTVVWRAPVNDWAFYNRLSGSTDTTAYEFSGITFEGSESGGGILINRANNGGELYLLVHDNRFIDNSSPGNWVNSMLLCHNRGVPRDATSGLGPVRIYNNIDETIGGICMSNSLAFDIFNNTFDTCADALFIGYGCPTNTTIGDHYIYLNDFQNQVGWEPSIYMGYWGSGTGMTFLPNIVALNTFRDSDNAIGYGMDSAIVYPADLFILNSFENIAGAGLLVAGANAAPVEATLNWWGSEDGPTHATNPGGGGAAVSDNVIYSPWLGVDPDAVPGTRGVQLLTPLYIIVDDIGPAPTEQTYDVPAGLGLPVSGTVILPAGYLNRAIGAANAVPGIDTIEVRHGTYDASEPITEGAIIVSEVGSATHTILNGAMSLDAVDILLGRLRQGFTINGPITVGVGTNASTIHINWNDIYGVVTNNGTGTLDAIFNYWGEDGPDTVGLVDIYPLLPTFSDTIISYMDDHGLSALDAIDFAILLELYLSEREALAAVELMNAFGFSEEEAAELVEEYGVLAVNRALAFCGGNYDDFIALLMGYASGGGGGGSYLGGGAGGGTGISIFCVGCTIPLQIELVHPITGEPITDAVVSYSVCRTLPDGTTEIVMLGVMTYDGDLCAYTFEVDTTGLEPGIYDIYIGTDDGRSRHFQIEIAVF